MLAKRFGIVCAGEKLVVQLIEFPDTFVLMAEDLDNLLTFHHLFDITIDNTKVCLLLQEIFSAQPASFRLAVSIMATISRVTKVSGTFRISILTRTLTMVITLESSCGKLWLIIWRRVSMSLV